MKCGSNGNSAAIISLITLYSLNEMSRSKAPSVRCQRTPSVEVDKACRHAQVGDPAGHPVLSLPREPALAREIAPQIGNLAAVMEAVDQDNPQKISDLSGAAARGRELAVQVRRREGLQDGQRFLPHGIQVAEQIGAGGGERRHLFQRIARAN